MSLVISAAFSAFPFQTSATALAVGTEMLYVRDHHNQTHKSCHLTHASQSPSGWSHFWCFIFRSITSVESESSPTAFEVSKRQSALAANMYWAITPHLGPGSGKRYS
jgi:hypothetical protein